MEFTSAAHQSDRLWITFGGGSCSCRIMSSGSYDSTIIATVTQKFREGESILAVSFCLKNVFLILVVRIQLDLEGHFEANSAIMQSIFFCSLNLPFYKGSYDGVGFPLVLYVYNLLPPLSHRLFTSAAHWLLLSFAALQHCNDSALPPLPERQ